jgi:hypothetical protein
MSAPTARNSAQGHYSRGVSHTVCAFKYERRWEKETESFVLSLFSQFFQSLLNRLGLVYEKIQSYEDCGAKISRAMRQTGFFQFGYVSFESGIH